MELTFKEWFYFSESIIINDGGTDAALMVVEPSLIRDFNYQFENGYSTFFIAPYQAQRVGYIHISSQPNHVGITKTTPIEAGMGVDIAFLKNLTANLASAGFQSVPFKEGESDWVNVAKQLPGGEELAKGFQGPTAQIGQSQIPDIKTGASNQQQVRSSVSVSKASGSWSFFVKTQSARYALERILDIMKRSIQPLLDNDLVEFYEVVDRMSQRRLEVVHSKHGQSLQDDWQSQWNNSVGYIKYLAEVLLKAHPAAKKLVLDRLHGVGAKIVGGGTHPATAVQPQNAKIPFAKLIQFINQSYAENMTLLFFIKAAQTDNDHLYSVMDNAASFENPSYALYFVDEISSGRMENFFADEQPYLNQISQAFKYSDFLEKSIPEAFHKFAQECETGINSYLENPTYPLNSSEIEDLKFLADYLTFDPKIVAQLDQIHAQNEKDKVESANRRKEQREKQSHLLITNSAKYIVINKGETTWQDVPDQYVDRDGEVYYSEFILSDIVDYEDIQWDAYEKAQEDVAGNAEARPSDTYGNDREEVLGDLGYDWDDYVNDRALDDLPEDASEDEWIDLIQSKYYEDYLQWKIAKLKVSEEEESWRYEPEPDERDIQNAAEEIAVPYAFDDLGLVILKTDDRNNIEIEAHSKYKSKILQLLKKTVGINLQHKDEFDEPHLRGGNTITFDFRDKNRKESISAAELNRLDLK